MKKPLALLISVLLVLTLTFPATVLASGKGGGGHDQGKHARAANAPTVTSNGHTAPGQAKKALKLAAKDARKAARLETKTLRKGPQHSMESSATSPTVKASVVEGTKSVGPGVANALGHIVANLTRKFAKFGDALPQGLVNVWFKFSTWLGISTEARPWEPVTIAPVDAAPTPSEITTPPPSEVPSQ